MTTNYIFKHLISAVECGLQAASAVLNHQIIKAKCFLFQAWNRSFADFKRSEEKHELKSDSNLKVTDKEKKLQLGDQNHESDDKKRTSEQQEKLVSNNQNEDLENHQTYLQQNFHQRHVSHHQNDTGTTTVDIDKVHISESKYIINEQKEAALENTATGSAGQMPSISCDVRTQYYNERNVYVYYQTDRDICLKDTEYILKDLRDSQEQDELLENKYTVDISPLESEKNAFQSSEGQDVTTVNQDEGISEQKIIEVPINDQNKIENLYQRHSGSHQKEAETPTEEQKNVQNKEAKGTMNEQKEAAPEESTMGNISLILSIIYNNEKKPSDYYQTERFSYQQDTEYNLKDMTGSQRQDESLAKKYTIDVSLFESEKIAVQCSEGQDISTIIQAPINDQNKIEDTHKSFYGSREKVSGIPTEEQKNIQNSEQKDINQQKEATHEESTTGSASPMLSISCDDEHRHYFNEKSASGHFQTEGFHYLEDTEYNLKHLRVSQRQDESLGKEYTMDLSLFELKKNTVQSSEQQDITMKIQGEWSSEQNITVVPINEMKKREDLHNNFDGSHREETGTPKEKKENSEFKYVINQQKKAAHEDSTMGSTTQMSSVSYDDDFLHYNTEKYVSDNYPTDKYNYREALEDNLKDLKASQRQDESLDKNFTMDLSPLESEKATAQRTEQYITTLIQGVGSSEQKTSESIINDQNKIEDFHQRHDSCLQNETGTPMEHQENISNIEFKDIINEQNEASHEDSTIRNASQRRSISSNYGCIHYYNEKDATDYYQTEQFNYWKDPEYTLKDLRVSERQDETMNKKITLDSSPLESDKTIVQSSDGQDLTKIIKGKGSYEQKTTEIPIDDQNKIEDFHKMLSTEDQGDIQNCEFKVIQQKDNERNINIFYQTERDNYWEDTDYIRKDLRDSQVQDETLENKYTVGMPPLESENNAAQSYKGQEVTTIIQDEWISEQKITEVPINDHNKIGDFHQRHDSCSENETGTAMEHQENIPNTEFKDIIHKQNEAFHEDSIMRSTSQMCSISSNDGCIHCINEKDATDYNQTKQFNFQEDTEYTLKDLRVSQRQDESLDKKFTLGLSPVESDKTIAQSFEGQEITTIIQEEGRSEQKNTEISTDDQNKIEDFHKMLGDSHQKETGSPTENQGDIQNSEFKDITQQKDAAHKKCTAGSICQMLSSNYNDECIQYYDEININVYFQTERDNYWEDTDYILKDLRDIHLQDKPLENKDNVCMPPPESENNAIQSSERKEVTTIIQDECISEQKIMEVPINQNTIVDFHHRHNSCRQNETGTSMQHQENITIIEYRDIIHEQTEVSHEDRTMRRPSQIHSISSNDKCTNYYNEKDASDYYQTEQFNYWEDSEYTLKDLRVSERQDKSRNKKIILYSSPLDKTIVQSSDGQDITKIIQGEENYEQKPTEISIDDQNKIEDFHKMLGDFHQKETDSPTENQGDIQNSEFKDITQQKDSAHKKSTMGSVCQMLSSSYDDECIQYYKERNINVYFQTERHNYWEDTEYILKDLRDTQVEDGTLENKDTVCMPPPESENNTVQSSEGQEVTTIIQGEERSEQKITEVLINDQNKIGDFHQKHDSCPPNETETTTEHQENITNIEFKDIIHEQNEDSTMRRASQMHSVNSNDGYICYYNEKGTTDYYQEDTEYTLKGVKVSSRQDESIDKKFTLHLSPLESDKTVVQSFEGQELTTIIQGEASSEQKITDINDQNKTKNFFQQLINSQHNDQEIVHINESKYINNKKKEVANLTKQIENISINTECELKNEEKYFSDNIYKQSDPILLKVPKQSHEKKKIPQKESSTIKNTLKNKNYKPSIKCRMLKQKYSLSNHKPFLEPDICPVEVIQNDTVEMQITQKEMLMEDYIRKDLRDSQIQDETLENKYTVGMPPFESENKAVQISEGQEFATIIKDEGISEQKIMEVPINDQNKIGNFYERHDSCLQNETGTSMEHQENIQNIEFRDIIHEQNEASHEDSTMRRASQMHSISSNDECTHYYNEKHATDYYQTEQFNYWEDPEYTLKDLRVSERQDESMNKKITLDSSPFESNKTIVQSSDGQDLTKIIQEERSYDQKPTEISIDDQNKIENFYKLLGDSHQKEPGNPTEGQGDIQNCEFKDIQQKENERNVNIFYQTERDNYWEDTDYIRKDLRDSQVQDETLENNYIVGMPPLESENNSIQSYEGQEVTIIIQGEESSEQKITEVLINDQNKIGDFHQKHDSCPPNETGTTMEHQEYITNILFKDIIHEQNEDSTMRRANQMHSGKSNDGYIHYYDEKGTTDYYQENTEYTLKGVKVSLRQDESMDKKFTLRESPLESDKTVVQSFEGQELTTIIQGEGSSEQKITEVHINDQNKTEIFFQQLISSHHNDQEIVHINESKYINNKKKEVANLTKQIENISINTEREWKNEEKYFSDNIYKQNDPVFLNDPKQSHEKKQISQKGSSTIKITLKNKNYKPSIKCRMLKQKYSLMNHKSFLEPDNFPAEMTENDTVELQITQKEMLMDETEKNDVIMEKTDSNNYQILPVTSSQKENQKKNQEEIRTTEAKQTICNLKEIISEKRHSLENDEIFSISQVMKFTMDCSEKDTSCIGQVEMTQGDHVEMENKHKKCVSYTQNNSLSIPQLEISKVAVEASVEKYIFASTLEHTCCQKYDISNKQKYISSNEINENQNDQKDIEIYSHHNVSLMFQNEENNVTIQNLEDDETDLQKINLIQLQKLKSCNIKKDEITQRNAIQMEPNFTTEKTDVTYQDTLVITPGQKDLNKNQKEILITENKQIIFEIEETIPKQRGTLEDEQMYSTGEELLMSYHHQEEAYSQQKCNNSPKNTCEITDIRSSEEKYIMNNDLNTIASYIQKDYMIFPQLETSKEAAEDSIGKDLGVRNLKSSTHFQKNDLRLKQKVIKSNEKVKTEILGYIPIYFNAKEKDIGIDSNYDDCPMIPNEVVNQNITNIDSDTQKNYYQMNLKQLQQPNSYDIITNEMTQRDDLEMEDTQKKYSIARYLQDIEIDTHQKCCKISPKQSQQPKPGCNRPPEMTQTKASQKETTHKKMSLNNHEKADFITERRDVSYSETLAIIPGQNGDLKEIIPDQEDTLENDQMVSICPELEVHMNYDQEEVIWDMSSEARNIIHNDLKDTVTYTQKKDRSIPQLQSSKEDLMSLVEKDLCARNLENNTHFQTYVTYKHALKSSNVHDISYDQIEILNTDLKDNVSVNQNYIENYGHHDISPVSQNEAIERKEKDPSSEKFKDIEMNTQQKCCQINPTEFQKQNLVYIRPLEMTQGQAVQMETTHKKITLNNHEKAYFQTEKRDITNQETLAISLCKKDDLKTNQEEILITEPKEIICEVEDIAEQTHTLDDDKMFSISPEFDYLMDYQEKVADVHQKRKNKEDIICIQKKARYDLIEARSFETRYTMNDDIKNFVIYTKKEHVGIPPVKSSKETLMASVENDICPRNLENNTHFQKYDISYKKEQKCSNQNDLNYDQIQILNNDLIDVPRYSQNYVNANQKCIKNYGHHISPIFQIEAIVNEDKDAIRKTLNNIENDTQQKYCQTTDKQLEKRQPYYIKTEEMNQRDAKQMETIHKKITLDDHENIDVTKEERDISYQEALAITPGQKKDLNKNQIEILISEPTVICEVEEIIPKQRGTLEDGQMFAIGQEHLMNYHQEDKNNIDYIQKEAICDLKDVRYTMNDDAKDFVSYIEKDDRRIPQLDSDKVVVNASVEKDHYAINLEHSLYFQKYDTSNKQNPKSSNKEDIYYDQIQILNNDMMDVLSYNQISFDSYSHHDVGPMFQNEAIVYEIKKDYSQNLENIEIDTHQKYCQINFMQLQKTKSYSFTTTEMTQKGAAVPVMSTLSKITLDDHEKVDVTIEERVVSYEETLAISPGHPEDLNQEKVLITKPKEKIYEQEEIIPEKKDNLKDDKLLFTINQKCQFIMNYHQEDNYSHHKCNNEDDIIHIKKKARYDLKEVWSSKMRYTMNDGLRNIISYTQKDNKSILQLESSTKAEASEEKDLYLNNLENKTYFQKNDLRYKSEDIGSYENDINNDKIEIPNSALIAVVSDSHINVNANKKGTGYEKQDAINENLQNIGLDAQQKYCQINFKHLQKEKPYYIRPTEMIQQKVEQIETLHMTRTLHDYKKTDITTEKRDAHYAATLAITLGQKNDLITDHEETLITEPNEIICEQEKIIPEHTDPSKDGQIFARCRQPEVEKDHSVPVMSYEEDPTAYKPVEKVISQKLMGHISNQRGEFQQKLANMHLPHATQLAIGENLIIKDPKTLITDNEESAKKRDSRFEEITQVTIDKIDECRTDQLKSLPEENKETKHAFDQTTLFQRTDNGCNNSLNDFQHIPKPSEGRKLRISKILHQDCIPLEKEQSIFSPGKILSFYLQLYHFAMRNTECHRHNMILKIAPQFIKTLVKKLHPAKSAKNVLKRPTDSVFKIPKSESSVVACGPQSSISDFWIPEFSLNFAHREILMSNAWLDDRMIDAAQSLLRRQYNVDGLQSIVLSMVESTPISGAGVQIHYDDMEHWFTSSTMSSRVEVADSLLPNKLSKSVQNQLLKRYWNRRENGRLEVYLLPVDRQPNAYDCGLYAIANAIEFLEENGNPLAKYDNRLMRHHLLLCLENRVLEPFPKSSKKRRLSRITGRKIVI